MDTGTSQGGQTGGGGAVQRTDAVGLVDTGTGAGDQAHSDHPLSLCFSYLDQTLRISYGREGDVYEAVAVFLGARHRHLSSVLPGELWWQSVSTTILFCFQLKKSSGNYTFTMDCQLSKGQADVR